MCFRPLAGIKKIMSVKEQDEQERPFPSPRGDKENPEAMRQGRDLEVSVPSRG